MATASSDQLNGALRGTSKRPNGLHVQLSPAIKRNEGDAMPDDTPVFFDAPEQLQASPISSSPITTTYRQQLNRSAPSTISSIASIPPPGSVLTGKQEHYLKRELLSQQTQWEVHELSHPTALQRFGAPFRSDAGEVAPEDSELPLLRYIFVHFVRNFPFLNQAKEKDFWQDKLQTFLESFANKHISSAEDRLEQTKRAKLALKATKLVELMMVSGIPTASGYEERIRFSEMEVVDSGPNEQGLVVNRPEGHEINGWDVNVAGVRIVKVKHHLRSRDHAEFILRVKRGEEPEIYIGRRFGEFNKMHKKMRHELPGKVLPPMPRKNKSHSLYSGGDSDDDDDESILSRSTRDERPSRPSESDDHDISVGGIRGYLSSWTGSTPTGRHSRNHSRSSLQSGDSPRPSIDSTAVSIKGGSPERSDSQLAAQEPQVLHREEQRVSLRAFIRTFLQNEAIANSNTMFNFLTRDPFVPNAEERADMARRKAMDEKRLEEQRQFFEIARERARELNVHMEKFRRKVIERNGLRELFSEIRQKEHIADLDPEYKKFAEWLRIEVAATLYHLFLAEDNSPELFAQAKRIHSLVPYSALKQVIRFTNPAAVMSAVLDIFMAQPLGAKSLLQRIFGYALGDGIRSLQRSIDSLVPKIGQPAFCERIANYTSAPEDIKQHIRAEAQEEKVDIVVKILQSPDISPPLSNDQIAFAFNAYVAWEHAVENTIQDEMRAGAQTYVQLKQLMKLHTRQRDKRMMLAMVEEPNTLRLFRDLFTIFYEPLVRVYKSANVYNSVTDFARFADDAIATIEKAQRQDVSADPNQTVQAFIDLCERHEEDLYKFIHEVHIHDDGLFDRLMTWIESILGFLREGPRNRQGIPGKLDLNALFLGAVEMKQIDREKAIREINSLIKWQMARKRWHQDKTRLKMATSDPSNPFSTSTASNSANGALGGTFKASDFGLNAMDLQDLDLADEDDEEDLSEDEEEEALDPIEAERKRRKRHRDLLRQGHGEPVKPVVQEVHKLGPGFLSMLRVVLAE